MKVYFVLLLATLATYRLSLMVTKENGPFHVFAKLRARSKRTAKEWLSCIFCFSITCSAFICFLLYLDHWRFTKIEWFLLWLGLSSCTILLNQYFTKGKL